MALPQMKLIFSGGWGEFARYLLWGLFMTYHE